MDFYRGLRAGRRKGQTDMTLQQLRYAIAVADYGSMNQAAAKLIISQPSLSEAVKELEKEIGIRIFGRTNRGILVTTEGNEFLGYARQVVEQYRLMEQRYVEKTQSKKRFAVSMQHYTFAVKAFVEMVKEFGMDDYAFAIHETKTGKVIEHVKDFVSEVGILYMSDFNRKILTKLIHESELEFIPLFDCKTYVYVWKGNPIASKKSVSLKELQNYPCLTFDQGKTNSFYFAEEVFSTYEYKQTIQVDDRASMLNLMVGLNGYTLCSGIICEELNGSDYAAVLLEETEIMTIGYVKRKNLELSELARRYVNELAKYQKMVLN